MKAMIFGAAALLLSAGAAAADTAPGLPAIACQGGNAVSNANMQSCAGVTSAPAPQALEQAPADHTALQDTIARATAAARVAKVAADQAERRNMALNR